jgi:sugar phosphate isomerase/epimerase
MSQSIYKPEEFKKNNGHIGKNRKKNSSPREYLVAYVPITGTRKVAMKLAFSTSWAGGDIERVKAVLPYIDSLEIGSKGDRRFFKDLGFLLRDERFPVTSIHAVAHPDKEIGEAYYAPRLASLDERVRLREVGEICNTAEWALEAGAGAIVIHTGWVENDELKTMCLAHRDAVRDTGEHDALLFESILERRASLSRPYLESIIESLSLICQRFPELNFFIETRVHYYEIPLPDELDEIFTVLSYPNLGYWHDIGHTYMMDTLGYVPMTTWQERFAHRCGGAHVHDINERLIDHAPPGEGMLDIHRILEQFGSDALMTLEINARNDLESVIRGIHYMRADRICV